MKHTQQTLREENYKKEPSASVWKYYFFFKVKFLTYLKIQFTKWQLWKLPWSDITTKALMCAGTGVCSDASVFVCCSSSNCLIIRTLYLLKDLWKSKEMKSLEVSFERYKICKSEFLTWRSLAWASFPPGWKKQRASLLLWSTWHRARSLSGSDSRITASESSGHWKGHFLINAAVPGILLDAAL